MTFDCCDIGQSILEHCTRFGTETVIGMGRRGVTAKVAAKLDKAGIQLHWLQVDLSDSTALIKAWHQLPPLAAPVSAVFHAAGLTIDASFSEAHWSQFEKIAAAKVLGTQSLLQLMAQRLPQFEPRLWVFFSSLAAAVGNIGQAHYAAANAYQDAVATRLQQAHQQAVSINWGPWKNTQMVKAAESATELAKDFGLWPLSKTAAMKLLDEAMMAQQPRLLSAAIDRESFSQFPGADHSAFSQFIVQSSAQQQGQWQQLIDKLTRADKKERKVILLDVLVSRTKEVLEMDNASLLDPEQPLQSLGLDSMLAIDLRNQLNQLSGLSLPATLLFDYPTLSAISDYLLEKMFAHEPQEEHTEQPAEPLIDDAPLDDAALDSALEQMLIDLVED